MRGGVGWGWRGVGWWDEGALDYREAEVGCLSLETAGTECAWTMQPLSSGTPIFCWWTPSRRDWSSCREAQALGFVGLERAGIEDGTCEPS